MVVNFSTRSISRNTRKLIQTFKLIKNIFSFEENMIEIID
jgi:hypothetical protein